jgi:hypothetical protein
MAKHAIITGDIVASRKIAPAIREKLYEDLNSFLKTIKKKWLKTYETYRGDSLQCEVGSPKLSLRTALLIRSFVMSYVPENIQKKNKSILRKGIHLRGYSNIEFDIRLGVGIGPADFIKKNKITSSDGKAFQLSGQALDSAKEEDQRLNIKTDNKIVNQEIEPLILLLDALTQKWTQNQAELVYHKLQNKKDEEISSLFNISRSAVNQRKKNAQWHAIEKAITYYESKIKD